MGIKNYVKKGIEGMWEHGGWRDQESSRYTQLVPIDYFDDMPAHNADLHRAGEISDRSTWSHRTKDEFLDRMPYLDDFEQLKQDMTERGLDEPLIISYNADKTGADKSMLHMKQDADYGIRHNTGRVLLAEGNHRLAAARELGWEAVPARVGRSFSPMHRFNKEADIEAMGGYDAQGKPTQKAKDEVGDVVKSVGEKKAEMTYIGMEASPSDIGIPIMPHGPHSPEGPVSSDQFSFFKGNKG